MDRNECIRILKDLLAQIENFSSAASGLDDAKTKLNALRTKSPSAVRDFDSTKKKSFIESKAGHEPTKPKGAIKLAVPIYLSKKKAYEKEYADYMERYKKAEKEYYAEFKDAREKLESEEKAAIAFEIQLAEDALNRATEIYQSAATLLSENEVLSEKLKDASIVATLIEYFQDQRADCIKEAVNLYYEEEHRKRLEAFAEEQVRLTAEATEQARLAAISASDAADSAEEALRRVDEAMRKAEEAYDRANEAYSEAQSAYWAATSNND